MKNIYIVLIAFFFMLVPEIAFSKGKYCDWCNKEIKYAGTCYGCNSLGRYCSDKCACEECDSRRPPTKSNNSDFQSKQLSLCRNMLELMTGEAERYEKEVEKLKEEIERLRQSNNNTNHEDNYEEDSYEDNHEQDNYDQKEESSERSGWFWYTIAGFLVFLVIGWLGGVPLFDENDGK